MNFPTEIIKRIYSYTSMGEHCFINKERNDSYYKKFTDYSAECDYQKCAVQCMIVPSDNTSQLSKTTYNINIKNFEEYAINYVKNQIKDLLDIAWWDWDENKIKYEFKNLWSNNIDDFINRHLQSDVISSDLFNR